MSDDFLNKLRRDPPPELEQGLRERLRRQGPADRAEPQGGGLSRFYRPALALAAAAAVVVAFTLSPALRASAEAFLDMFRVRNFVAVKVDPARMEQLNSGKIDVKSLLGDHVQELETPGPPRVFPDAASAGLAAGMEVRVPGSLPNGLVTDTVKVEGRAAARLTIDARKLREVLDALGLSDVRLPEGLDGAQATLRVAPIVAIGYKRDALRVILLQSASPEISLPQGLNLEELAEIGLRVAGLSAGEAHRFAAAIDWRTTALVPVPANASTFREVDVRGHKGLLVTTEGPPAGSSLPPEARGRWRRGAVLMWSEGEKVYALLGNAPSEDLLLIAGSLR